MDFAKFFNKRFVQVVKEKKKIMFEHGMTLTTQTPCLRSLRLRGQNSNFQGFNNIAIKQNNLAKAKFSRNRFILFLGGPDSVRGYKIS